MTSLVCRLPVAVLLATVVLLTGSPQAQGPPTAATPPSVNQSDDPLLKNFRWRSIGPANMGGRIDDIAVVESNPFVIYVGYATGGVWKTTNNGTTWTPIFDTYPVSSIGDLAVSQSNPDIVYVGTGEPNNRQSSSWGDGIYKSTDGGKTFKNVGLNDSQTIARIVIDPVDPNIVYVAALGHLFGANAERGVFKTIDGGKTWNKVKFIDDDTGFTDIVMDARDSRVLYAASYQRRRTIWGFNGGGPGSGIWKTTDAGRTWTRLEGNGLPSGPFGRIGIDVSRSKPNVVYAQIQVEMSGGGGGGGGGGGAGGGGGGGGQQADAPPDPKRSGVWRSDDSGKTWRLMSNNNNRPMYYSQIRVDPSNDQTIYTMGASFYKSTDGGKTFQVVQGIAHGDHHALWINPRNGQHLVLGNDGGLDVSYDQAATWEHINTVAVGQFYQIAVDMRRPYYVCGGLQDNGSFCGPSALRSNGPIINADWYRVSGGDGMFQQIDPTDFTVVYTESQNGNMSRLDLRTGESVNIRPRARPRPGQQGGGGGGGGGGGNPQTQTSNIVPEPPQGEQYRFHWTTPILLSPHNPRVVYTGANKFFKSVDRGDTWTASADLTKAIDRNTLPIMNVPGNQPMHSKNDGTSNYGNITTIAESPVQPGIIWVGTDDGNVQVSRDGGVTFTNVAPKIPNAPARAHVSRVEASHFDANTAYVSVDAHESDDPKPYVWVTRDLGATFTSIASNLPPAGNVNVIREDPKNRQLLYVGTEFGVYISINGGQEWKRFMTGLPTVRVDDLVVHPRDNDLIVGTHGRSILIVDDMTALQQWPPLTTRRETSVAVEPIGGPASPPITDHNEQAAAAPPDIHLFQVRPAVQWKIDTMLSRTVGAAKHFRGENLGAGTYVHYYLRAPVGGNVNLTITDISGRVVRTLRGTNDAGINRVRWNLRADPPRPAGAQPGGGQPGGAPQQGPPVAPGTYAVKLSAGGKDLTQLVVVEDDRWFNR